MARALLQFAAPLASLLLFSSFASAQITAATCPLAAWSWTFNSLGQSPCTVVANMMATCFGGEYTVPQLPQGHSYGLPYTSATSNLCYCNTVAYSLFGACDACQGEGWFDWAEWDANCTTTLPPSTFPNPVPAGIRVPRWALIDITKEQYVETWNATQSQLVGDSPELGPGSIVAPSSAAVTSTHSSSVHASGTQTGGPAAASGQSTGSPTPQPQGGGSSNTGAIVGGVVGGISAISIVAAVIFLCLRRRSRAPAAESAGVSASSPQPPLSDEVTAGPSSLSGSPTTMRLYNPSDPSTFPSYQSDPQSLNIASQVTMSSNIGSGNTLSNTQTSLLQGSHARGYHGLPTV